MNKKLSSTRLHAINRQTNERYGKRLRERGPGAHALGWGTRRFQVKRFHDLVHAVGTDAFHGKRVLDIGCGLGDLYSFLLKKGIRPSRYEGVDVNPEFIALAKRAFRSRRTATFEARDLMLKPLHGHLPDTGVALGVINFKQPNHEAYARQFITACFASVKEMLVVNVISALRNGRYPKESFIYYYDPAAWLKWAQTLTPFCSLIHDYAGEPQREFFLILRKTPWNA